MSCCALLWSERVRIRISIRLGEERVREGEQRESREAEQGEEGEKSSARGTCGDVFDSIGGRTKGEEGGERTLAARGRIGWHWEGQCCERGA